MNANKVVGEIGPVLTVNSTSFALCLTDLELVLKIVLLVISIVYTADRWLYYRRKNKKK
tara:strand:+ start:2061 stop:2237 length:177 start_codon:yes stop_codon:yes gene_type:complete